jgi:hypothetical protein
MIYFVILTDKTSNEVAAICRPVQERIERFLEDYPDQEHTFVEPWAERPEIHVQTCRNNADLMPEIERRLDRCKSALLFEGPGNPQECEDQVSVLKLYLEALPGSVMDWGGIDYGWPAVQTSEEALGSLRELPDDPRLLEEAQ